MYYEFLCNVETNIGEGSAVKIGEHFRRVGAEHPLLVAGPIINKVGIVDMLTADVKKGGVDIKAVFIDVPKDSSIDVVNDHRR